jgi:hypothetical protein
MALHERRTAEFICSTLNHRWADFFIKLIDDKLFDSVVLPIKRQQQQTAVKNFMSEFSRDFLYFLLFHARHSHTARDFVTFFYDDDDDGVS